MPDVATLSIWKEILFAAKSVGFSWHHAFEVVMVIALCSGCSVERTITSWILQICGSVLNTSVIFILLSLLAWGGYNGLLA
jgi:hypothetical protein